MTDAIQHNGGMMKKEGLLLTAVCLLMALLFAGLAGLNYFRAGQFITTDSLFFTSVCGMMALIFLLVPLATMRAEKKATEAPPEGQQRLASGKIRPLPPGTSVAAAMMMKDVKGRDLPPDVARMIEQMKETKAQ